MTLEPRLQNRHPVSRIALPLLLGFVGFACSPDMGPHSPEGVLLGDHGSSRTLLSVSGIEVEETTMRNALIRLTRSVAMALREESVRQSLRMAIGASRHYEGKVRVTDLLAAGRPLRMAIEGVDALEGTRTIALVDSILALELYLPVRDHRARWRGDGDYLVASQLMDGQAIIGCRPDGGCDAITRDAPPMIPTIVLVAAESDLDASSEDDVAFAECQPDEDGGGCGGGDGGGTGDDPVVWPAPGIYMTYAHLNDIGEDWTRGDPEIEVFLIGRSSSSGADGVGVAGRYAGEHAQNTGVFPRSFDQNGHTWSAVGINNPGVLLATKTDLDSIALRYPGFALDSVPFTLAVWEDDKDAGRIVKKDFWQDIVRPTIISITGALMIATVKENGERDDPHGLIAIPGATLIFAFADAFYNLYLTVIGGNDDFLGLIVEANAFYESTGTPSDSSYTIIRNTEKNGEAVLYMRNYSWE